MRRRNFMTVLAGAAAYPLLAGAQQKAMPVVGFLGSISPIAPQVAAFHQGLSETGYVEGQNVTIEYRWAEGSYDRLPALAADLVGRKVDLIVAQSDQSALGQKCNLNDADCLHRWQSCRGRLSHQSRPAEP